ncbi:DEAD/DEAH box helicase [bacterium]|nr:DEAD/DEAH box helicase [bacterium]
MSIAAYLGPKGRWLKEGMEFRRPQMEMAEAVSDALDRGESMLIEAGTGVGKSMAYLLPAALAAARDKIRVLVSTHTKALQQQLVEKDLPFLQEKLRADGIQFSFALFMGSENFLCLRRFHQAFRDSASLFDQDAHAAALARVKEFVDAHPAPSQSGLRMDLPEVPEEIWRQILRESDNCMSTHSPFYKACYHHAAQDRMKQADILVVNHALFFTNLAAGGRVLPNYDAVIFDEAHSVEEVAAAHMGISVSNTSIRWQLDQLHHPGSEKGLALRFASVGPQWRRSVMDRVKRLRTLADAFFETVRSALKAGAEEAMRIRKAGFVPDTLSRPLDDLSELLREGRDSLEKPEDKQELKAYADRIAGMGAKIRTFLSQEDRMMVYWVEVELRSRRARRDRVTLKASPVDLSKTLRQALFSKDGPPSILTSASLTVQNDFDFIRSRIGATEAAVPGISLGSPFDFARQALLYIPESLPDPVDRESEAYYAAVLKETRDLISASGGGAFVLCTSHDWVGRLFRDLSDEQARLADFHFFKQEGARSFGMLDEFRRTDRAVLIGTDTFWQGVDVPGDALRLVVVTRLPFARPTHPLEEARVEHLQNQGFDPFNRHTLPTAVLMLRQGVGRLIRREGDRGVIAILDPRIRTRTYGQVFLKSLPPAKRTTRLSDVRSFFTGAGRKGEREKGR